MSRSVANDEPADQSIVVRCPSCEQPFKLGAEAAGRKFSCKSCGKKVSVPTSGFSSPSGIVLDSDTSDTTRSWWGVALVVSSILFVAVACAAIAQLVSSGNSSAVAKTDDSESKTNRTAEGKAKDLRQDQPSKANQSSEANEANEANSNRKKAPNPKPATNNKYAQDFKTPQGAILCLEQANRDKDIEAAVRCRDFLIEARVMFSQLPGDFSSKQDMVDDLANTLELAYRAEISERGFPEGNLILSSATPFENEVGEIVTVNVVREAEDGNSTMQKSGVVKTNKGWRVISIVDPPR